MYTFLHKINWDSLREKLMAADSNKRKGIFKNIIRENHKLFLDSMFPILASMPLAYKEDKISATAIFSNMPDKLETPYYNFSKEEFKSYFGFLTFMLPSVWSLKSGTAEPKFSRLSPLVLAAFKEQKGIGYEEWDFFDDNIKYMMNCHLTNLIKYRTIDFSSVNPAKIREQACIRGTSKIPVTSWPTSRGVYITEDIKCKATDPLCLILGQLWAANTKFRNKLLVLDPNNWDHIPPALDAEIADVVKPKAPPIVKLDELPF